MALRSRVAGTGMSVPSRVVTNADMTQWMDTTEEWIEQRTGFSSGAGSRKARSRRISLVTPPSPPSKRRTSTSRTSTASCSRPSPGEHDFPGTSFFLHEAIDAGEIPCIDLRAQCSGFLYALQIADALIVAGRHDRILVVGCEVHSTGLDISTEGRDVTVIFGDGSGALILEGSDGEAGPGLSRFAFTPRASTPEGSGPRHRAPPTSRGSTTQRSRSGNISPTWMVASSSSTP